MSAVTELAVNLIALAMIAWLAVMFYFSYEDYRKGDNFCVTNDTIKRTRNVFGGAYLRAHDAVVEATKKENFEERELVPYDADLAIEPQAERATGLIPNVDEPEEADNYSDVLLSQLEPVILEQHAAYAKDSNHATRGASNMVERSNTEDVVQQWGLRRIKYGKDMLTKNATSVPSFEYPDEKTSHTALGAMLG
jgi:hypothetical protein